MPLLIICLVGAHDTGKSQSIREFTGRWLNYQRDAADIRAIFPMPRRNYTVGVSGAGDSVPIVREGLRFLDRYAGLRVMILACRTTGGTLEEVERYARRNRATLRMIRTERLPVNRREPAVRENAQSIMDLMPRRL